MLIWLLAVVLIGAFGALGKQTGGIRSSVSLVGVLVALAFAQPLGALLAPLLPSVGVASLTWRIVAAPVAGFLLIWLVFFGASFAAHRPVYLHFKYKEEDAVRVAFERMDSALGLFVGLLAGVILFLNVGRPIYSLGYLTTQTAAESGEQAPVGYLNQLRNDMAQTGWDKTFAALDHTPAQQYAVDDIIGLLMANPLVHARAKSYPEFLALEERQEFIELGGDADYQKMLQDRAGFTALYENPKTQGLLGNTEIRDRLLKLDLKDFRTYLETGKSAKYDEEKILGHWRCDVASTIIEARRKRADLKPADIKALRFVLNSFLKRATLTAYPEGRLALKVPPPEAAPAPVAAATQPPVNSRYGNRGRGAAAPPPPAAPVRDPAKMAAKLFAGGPSFTELSGEGTWSRTADQYLITPKGGTDAKIGAISDNGRLSIKMPELQLTLFFVRAI